MKPYANLNGDSGVTSYEISEGQIIVQFKGGKKYLYTFESTGVSEIAEMQKLAREGQGLATYISQNVKKNFAAIL